jgi:hypothetical protein
MAVENTAPGLGILGIAFNWRQEAAQHCLIPVVVVVAVKAMLVVEDAVVALKMAEDLLLSIAYVLLLSVANVLTVVLAAEDLMVSLSTEVNKDRH